MKMLFFIISLLIVSSVKSQLKDIDGHSYSKQKIGKQVWMTKNLDVSRFGNGDSIPEAKTSEAWKQAENKKQPAWCYFNNDIANEAKYGKLYNWFAVNDPRGLAPAGWHVPGDSEWTLLSAHLGTDTIAGKKMKSTSGWNYQGNGTNESGFSGLPGNERANGGKFTNYPGNYSGWWSATGFNWKNAWCRSLSYRSNWLDRNLINKNHGYYVRCIKDKD